MGGALPYVPLGTGRTVALQRGGAAPQARAGAGRGRAGGEGRAPGVGNAFAQAGLELLPGELVVESQRLLLRCFVNHG